MTNYRTLLLTHVVCKGKPSSPHSNMQYLLPTTLANFLTTIGLPLIHVSPLL